MEVRQAPIGERHTSLKALEWERIHRTLADSDFNMNLPSHWIVAPGTSCRHQMRDALGRKAMHPAQALALALEEPGV